MKPTLSPKEVAQAIGVSESSVKRWVDEHTIAAGRTTGGHRRIALTEAIRFVRASGIAVQRPDILGLTDFSAASSDDAARQSPGKTFLEAALAGRAPEARGMILSLYMAGHSAAEIWDHTIAPALRHVGELWQHQLSGIYIEHRATDICHQALHQLRAMQPAPPSAAPVAVGGAPAGDCYSLPTLMAATVVAAAGFRDFNLGPETPVETLAQAAQEYNAKLVWLAVSAARSIEVIQDETDQLCKSLARFGAQMVLGGRALPPDLVLRHPNSRVARTMAELEAFAQGLTASATKPPPPQL